jgi:hypothetical protein
MSTAEEEDETGRSTADEGSRRGGGLHEIVLGRDCWLAGEGAHTEEMLKQSIRQGAIVWKSETGRETVDAEERREGK